MKKGMTSKKRFLLSIASAMLVAYILSMVGIVLSAISSVESDFYSSDTYDYRAYDLTYEEGVTIENAIPEYLSYGTRFPKAVALYDKNGALVHTSGTTIQFKEYGKGMRYCYLDEFLTETDLNRLIEFAHDVSRVSIDEFKYYQSDDGEIIPVFCVFSGFNELKFKSQNIEIKFNNDYTDEKDICASISNDFTIISLYEDDVVFGKSQSQLYRELIEEVKSEKYSKEAVQEIAEHTEEDGTFNTFGGGHGMDNYDEYCSGILINDEQYYCVELKRYDYPPQIWYSHRDSIVSVSIFFVVFVIVLLRISSKFCEKTEELEETKTAFISAMTHEMKTPIAIIQNQCECVLENIAPEKNQEYLKSIYDETQKMNKLVADMLQYNRVAQSNELNKEKCNLSEIVKEEAEKYKKQFELHEKTVTLNIKETAIVKCDKNLIALVVDNMLSNTIKHTENGGEVIVTVKDGVDGYKVTVYNSGSTVPENEKEKIWSVLYKTDKSRTDRDKSSGVGLAVSAKILDLHKSSYGCENVENGVKFYFYLK